MTATPPEPVVPAGTQGPAAPHVAWRGGRWVPALLGVAFAVLAGGCRVDALVTVAVEDRGGEVSVRFEADEEAVAILGGPEVIAQGASVADLRRAGWQVTGPRRTGAGGAVVEAAKAFSHPGGLGPLVAELAGPEGPLRAFRLDRDRRLTRRGYRLAGEIDLRSPGEALSGFANDPELARRLDAAGVDAGRIAELLAERAAEGLRLEVVVDLPGEDPVRFAARAGERAAVRAASTVPDRVRPLLLVVAGALSVAAGAVLVPRRRS